MTRIHRVRPGLLAVSIGLALVTSTGAQTPAFYPLVDVRPGMVGIGRTVYAGTTLEEFRAEIIGVLENVIGPSRNLILARLSGGPLATTGVMQGMSGSPVYIDGRLVGAVSYALGSFPKEPLAGITPIGEMVDAIDRPAPVSRRGANAEWPTSIEGVAARLAGIITTATPAVGLPLSPALLQSLPGLADLSPTLRPIGAAMVMSGVSTPVASALGQAAPRTDDQSARPAGTAVNVTGLRPGDPVGMSLVRGDLELGATGTVTHVDGARVYAFGHPFLNLGPTSMAMTRAEVLAVLPSLDTSMKIAALGPVIGEVRQDRATAVGGLLGAPPDELQVQITLKAPPQAPRTFTFSVLHDETLTPLFAFVTVFNTLVGYERNAGALSISARGSVDYGALGRIDVDDIVTGPTAISAIAAAATASMGPAAGNEFRAVLPERLTLELEVTEAVNLWTIERAWLDTTRPAYGSTHALNVMLRHYRGGERTITMPVTMPARASGPITLHVLSAPAVQALERAWRPAQPASLEALFAQLSEQRPSNRLYVRLTEGHAGTTVGGTAMPALPGSVRSVLSADASSPSATIPRTLLGAWSERLDGMVGGSHELTLTLTSVR